MLEKYINLTFLSNTPRDNLQIAGKILLVSIIFLGIIVRIKQYGAERSLWLDELFFVVNFLERDWMGIMQLPLDYSSSHVAPPGFMLLVFALVKVAGLTEPVLRFLPLVFGIGALFVFERLIRNVLSPTARPIALFFFAVSDSLVFYSAEFKQYSCDVFIVLLFLLWFGSLHQQLTRGRLIQLACIGAILMWFSHPIAFLLGATGLYFSQRSIREGNWRLLIGLILVAVLWLISFMLMYYAVGGTVKDSEIGRWLVAFWHIQDGFMPSFGVDGFYWLGRRFLAILKAPGDLEHPLLVCLLIGFGVVSLYTKKKRHYLFVFIFSAAFAVFASYLEKYPIADRLVLFALPAIYICQAEGVAHFFFTVRSFSNYFPYSNFSKKMLPSILTFSLLIYVTQFPIYSTQYRQEIKPVLDFVQKNKEATDSFYIYHWAEPAFRFYGERYGFDVKDCVLINTIPQLEYTMEIDFYRKNKKQPVVNYNNQRCILGVSYVADYILKDVNKLKNKGGNIWFIFSHISTFDIMRFEEYLDQIGVRKKMISKPGSSAYLYKL